MLYYLKSSSVLLNDQTPNRGTSHKHANNKEQVNHFEESCMSMNIAESRNYYWTSNVQYLSYD